MQLRNAHIHESEIVSITHTTFIKYEQAELHKCLNSILSTYRLISSIKAKIQDEE